MIDQTVLYFMGSHTPVLCTCIDIVPVVPNMRYQKDPFMQTHENHQMQGRGLSPIPVMKYDEHRLISAKSTYDAPIPPILRSFESS